MSVDGANGVSANSSTVRSVENASATFERVMRDATGLPMNRDDVDDGSMQELEQLTRKNRIQERLEAMKSKMQDTK